MIWLAAQMWLLLLTAFAIGVATGWLAWRQRVAIQSPTVGVDPHEPMLLATAPAKGGDDLTQIIGIDAGTAEELKSLGIHSIAQIASWNPGHALWIELRLGVLGRISNERWIEQAQTLVDGV